MTYENDKTPGRYKRIVKRGFNDVIYVIQQQDKISILLFFVRIRMPRRS